MTWRYGRSTEPTGGETTRRGAIRAHSSLGQMGSGRRVQVGANVGMAGLFGGDLDSPVQIEFIGERYGRPGSAPDHRVTLFGIANFVRRAPEHAVQPGRRGVRRRRVRPVRRAAPATGGGAR